MLWKCVKFRVSKGSFLVVKGTEHDETLSTELVVVLNWSSELEHLSSGEDGRTKSGQTR